MAVGDAHVFPGFLAPLLTQLFFPKPPSTFLTFFCRGERRKYAEKKVRLNRGSSHQVMNPTLLARWPEAVGCLNGQKENFLLPSQTVSGLQHGNEILEQTEG